MNDLELFREIVRKDFASFARRAILELMPELDLKWNWHLDVIAYQLTRLACGDIRKLMINVPPRSLKSLMASVIFPAWLLGRQAHLQLTCISYAQSLGEDFARKCLRLIESPFYRRVFDTRVSPAKRAVDQFETTAGGVRITTSVGGTVTGRGGDFMILDDPMKPDEALSEAGRKSTRDWVRSTLVSRPNDKKNSRMLVVMQRLHEDDIAAGLIAQGNWEVLSLPAIAVEEETHRYETIHGPEVKTRLPGEALHPAHEPIEVLDQLRTDMGPYLFMTQYQQQPVPVEGNLVKRAWFGSYDRPDSLGFDQVVQSWDTASKADQIHDYSVCTTWGVRDGTCFLLDVFRARLELPALKHQVIILADRYRAEVVLIEDAGSGIGLQQELKVASFYKSIPIPPQGDKVSRFHGITPMIEGKRVFLPKDAPWLETYLHEVCGFPGGKHDDQVDSTSQALHWIREKGSPGGIWQFMKEENQRLEAEKQGRTVRLRAPPGRTHFYDGNGFSILISGGIIWLTEAEARIAVGSGFVRVKE